MSWLVEGLWETEGVGILGGAPKSCKSWLALDLAFSVATGTRALGKYEVKTPGPVLIFAAEDQPARVRSRLEGLAAHRGQNLERAPLHLIVESALRLDTLRDQNRSLARSASRCAQRSGVFGEAKRRRAYHKPESTRRNLSWPAREFSRS